MFCTACRAVLSDEAEACWQCGKGVHPSLRKERPPAGDSEEEQPPEGVSAERDRPRSEETAVALSVALGAIGCLGIGHLYGLCPARGLMFLFTGWAVALGGTAATLLLPGSRSTAVGLEEYQVVMAAGSLLVYLVVWMWQAVDARLCARERNDLRGSGDEVSRRSLVDAGTPPHPQPGVLREPRLRLFGLVHDGHAGRR